MIGWLLKKSKGFEAATYAFSVALLLDKEKLGLDVETYPCLIPLFRMARISGLSPERCVKMIADQISSVDADMSRTEPGNAEYRRHVLEQTLIAWERAAAMP